MQTPESHEVEARCAPLDFSPNAERGVGQFYLMMIERDSR